MDRGRTGWLALFPLVIVALIHGLYLFYGPRGIAEGELLDPDAYMRLNRVVALHESGAWFDDVYERIGPPEGHAQHWTRPLDALLLAGGWLLGPVLDFRPALHAWSVLISPALHVLAVLTLLWATRPLFDARTRLMTALLFALQPAIFGAFRIGRPDHHGLLLLLFVALIGLLPRMIARPAGLRACIGAAAVSALSIWISTEALLSVAVAVLTLGLFWLFEGERWLRLNLAYAGGCALFLLLALGLERGPGDLLAVESDRLSIVHVVLFALVALFWATVPVLGHVAGGTAVRGWFARGACAALGAVLVFGCLLLVFPSLAAGPLGLVDPLYEELRLKNIYEIQPLVPLAQAADGGWRYLLAEPLVHVGIALAAVPYLLVLLGREAGTARRFWAFVGVGLLVFLPVAVYQVRWLGYTEALLVFPYGALIGAVLQRLERKLPEGGLTLVRPVTSAFFLTWPFLLFFALPAQQIERITDSCPLRPMAAFLQDAGGGERRVIMTLADYGPELLYRTDHAVLSIPNHRPQPGFTATYHAMTSTDDARARDILQRHGVDWVLLCPSEGERVFYGADRQPTSLYSRLIEGRGPAWLRPIALPEPLSKNARLFEVAG